MRDLADNQTTELFPDPRRRGRPSTGQAKSAAERMKAYRARKKEEGILPKVSDLVPELRKDSIVTENSEIEQLTAEVEALEKRNLELQMKVDAEHAKALRVQTLESEIGRLKAELSEQRKANGVLKGQLTAVKNRTGLQVQILKELVSAYTWCGPTGSVYGQRMPVSGSIHLDHLEEMWARAYDLLKS
jgi:predicted RNase H-like nuclease (RuvC/YqgF family)